jgi:hypothetical protein
MELKVVRTNKEYAERWYEDMPEGYEKHKKEKGYEEENLEEESKNYS